MKIPSSTDALIKELLNATCGQDANVRQKFIFKQALLGLVRLAKAEQVFEMRTTVEKLIGSQSSIKARQRSKSRQGNLAQSGRWPQQMEFSQFN
jgi:hypothetical protein